MRNSEIRLAYKDAPKLRRAIRARVVLLSSLLALCLFGAAWTFLGPPLNETVSSERIASNIIAGVIIGLIILLVVLSILAIIRLLYRSMHLLSGTIEVRGCTLFGLSMANQSVQIEIARSIVRSPQGWITRQLWPLSEFILFSDGSQELLIAPRLLEDTVEFESLMKKCGKETVLFMPHDRDDLSSPHPGGLFGLK